MASCRSYLLGSPYVIVAEQVVAFKRTKALALVAYRALHAQLGRKASAMGLCILSGFQQRYDRVAPIRLRVLPGMVERIQAVGIPHMRISSQREQRGDPDGASTGFADGG